MYTDRITGLAVAEVPTEVEPGRYTVSMECVLNDHSSVVEGTIVVDDGSLLCNLGPHHARFVREILSPDQEAALRQAKAAVVTISKLWGNAPDKLPCPLLPMDVMDGSELLPLEKELRDVLKAGHLHVISEQPRLDMRYDEELVAVSRVRRTSKRAARHLASHSESVQQRNISGGVVPKTLLARLSEDDYAIYENRVYARLLDNLDRHLRQREVDQREVRRLIEQALALDNAEDKSHQLRRDICELWGSTFDLVKISHSLDRANSLGTLLDTLLRAVNGLRQRGVYRLVPRAANVPDQIRITNILSHDQNYRHLVPLWHGIQSAKDQARLTPSEQLARNLESHNAYVEFVGLVLLRVIQRHWKERLRKTDEGRWQFDEAGRTISIEKDRDVWVMRDGKRSVVFVPYLSTAPLELPQTMQSQRIRIVCVPTARDEHGVTSGLANTASAAIQVSPLDLYVEERMAVMVQPWLRAPTLAAYGRAIRKVPSAVVEAVSHIAEVDCLDAASLVFVRPLDGKNRETILQALKMHANEDLMAIAQQSLAEVSDLASCWGCGRTSELKPNTTRSGFEAHCRSCELDWYLESSDANKPRSAFFRRSAFSGDSASAFNRYGRWVLRFPVEPLSPSA